MLVPLVLVMAAGVVVVANEVKDGKRLLKNPPVLPTFFLENAGDFSPVFFYFRLWTISITNMSSINCNSPLCGRQ